MAQRRPGEHLCPALPVPRVRLSAGDEQRGLARDAEVRHSGARSHRLRAAAEAAQRLRRDEEVLDAPEELRQPVVGVGGAQEEQGQERLALCTSWISQDSRVPWSPRGGTRVQQALLRGRWRSWRASLAAVSFSRHIRLASFCAFVQSRSRPEKWTRTRKAGSRGSVTPDPVS